MDITIDDMLSLKPWMQWSRKELLHITGGRESLTVAEALDLNIIWEYQLGIVLRRPVFTREQLFSLACDFSERYLSILGPESKESHGLESRQLLTTMRRYLSGDATLRDLSSAGKPLSYLPLSRRNKIWGIAWCVSWEEPEYAALEGAMAVISAAGSSGVWNAEVSWQKAKILEVLDGTK